MYLEKLGSGVPTGNGLVRAILAFLEDQRLEPTPVNYGFAYRVLSDPAGDLAREVARRTDGGIRLSGSEVEALGATIERAAPVVVAATEPQPIVPWAKPVEVGTARAADARRQVAGFASMVSAMHSETRDFGRDLAASEDALLAVPSGGTDIALAELARITAAMRARVDVAEARLEQATREASALREELAAAQEDARRDTTTDLPNRRAFQEAIAECGPGPVHLALCDVDHFKSVNDRYGHPVGDRVLKAIAATLARECHGHMVARYGGEEFAVLFTGIRAAEAADLLEAARQAVGARRYRLRESDTVIDGITLSAGFVTRRAGETVAGAIERADRLLYAAKGEGRNRMVGEKR